jgi:hypothetical protein
VRCFSRRRSEEEKGRSLPWRLLSPLRGAKRTTARRERKARNGSGETWQGELVPVKGGYNGKLASRDLCYGSNQVSSFLARAVGALLARLSAIALSCASERRPRVILRSCFRRDSAPVEVNVAGCRSFSHIAPGVGKRGSTPRGFLLSSEADTLLIH